MLTVRREGSQAHPARSSTAEELSTVDEREPFYRRSHLGRLLSYPLILMVVIAIQAMSLLGMISNILLE